jgi:hypothetical protein
MSCSPECLAGATNRGPTTNLAIITVTPVRK